MTRTTQTKSRYSGKGKEKVVTTYQRFKCSLCQALKTTEHFPFTTGGERSHSTCSQCLTPSLQDPGDWEALGLQQPSRSAQNLRSSNVQSLPSPELSSEEIKDETESPDVGEEPVPIDAKDESAAQSSSATRPSRKRKRASLFVPRKRGKKERPPPATHYTCRICVEEKHKSEFITWIPSLQNGKKTSNEIPFSCMKHLGRNPRNKSLDPVCKDCISHFLIASLESLGAENLGCLEPTCENPKWGVKYVLQHLPPKLHPQYYEDLFNLYWSRSPKLTCPYPNCTATGLLDQTQTPGFPNVECHSCQHRSCALCKVPWHSGQTCQQYRTTHKDTLINDEEAKALRLLARKGAKRCPRCQMAVEKDGGCDSMSCQYCQKYYSWSAAEPVRAATKTNAKAKGPRQLPPTDYHYEACEADALAAKKASQEAAGPSLDRRNVNLPNVRRTPLEALEFERRMISLAIANRTIYTPGALPLPDEDDSDL